MTRTPLPLDPIEQAIAHLHRLSSRCHFGILYIFVGDATTVDVRRLKQRSPAERLRFLWTLRELFYSLS
jgi:hypothetical protein